jgi:RHS repeat-associated protein
MLTAGGVSYQYDERGNQTDRGSDEFAWDHENRMTGLTIGSTTASYAYNGDGLRMSSTVGANTTSYVWDVAAGLPVILQDGTNTYVYGLGLISTYDGEDMTYRLTDGLGSTVNLCDASGNVLVTYTYDAFGAIRSQTGSSGNYWQSTGEQRDSESGFDYLRARYYDPETGRFLGQDPVGSGYTYAGNNPANLTDPSGMVPAGTCLAFNNDSHLWVGCSEADSSALVGDTWYVSYLTESKLNGVSDQAVADSLLAEVTPVPSPTLSDAVFQDSVKQAVGRITPPNTGDGGCKRNEICGVTITKLYDWGTISWIDQNGDGRSDFQQTCVKGIGCETCYLRFGCEKSGLEKAAEACAVGTGGVVFGIFFKVPPTIWAGVSSCTYGVVVEAIGL